MTAARKLDYYSNYVEETPLPSKRRSAKRSKVPVTLKICLLAACCVAVGLLYIQQQVTSYYLNMELVRLQEQVNVMQQRNDQAMLNLESQRSLKQIEQIARNELGMVDPTYVTTLVLDLPENLTETREPHSIWAGDAQSQDNVGFLAALAAWMNRVLPLGGVEAGTLQR
ncbi:MAG: septum formation initiator family protein [Bacillota bacterium]|jgi:cell division protein FtsL|nr:septum formation initiator family protein [Bacillota bacterium]